MEQESKPKKKISRLRYAAGVVALVVLAVVLASFVLGHVGNYEIISNSMAPTLRRGDRVLVDQRLFYKPVVGDVIVLDDPEGAGDLLTKRMAAGAGQTVEFRDGYLLVDGRKWTAPGQKPVALPRDHQSAPITLAEDELFVLGDNALDSLDSTSFGPVPADSVRGKVRFIYWPPHHFGTVDRSESRPSRRKLRAKD